MSRSYLKRTIDKIHGIGSPINVEHEVALSLQQLSTSQLSNQLGYADILNQNQQVIAILPSMNDLTNQECQIALGNNQFQTISLDNFNQICPEVQNVQQLPTPTNQYPIIVQDDHDMYNNNGMISEIVCNETQPVSELQEFYLCNKCKVMVFTSYDMVKEHQRTCDGNNYGEFIDTNQSENVQKECPIDTTEVDHTPKKQRVEASEEEDTLLDCNSSISSANYDVDYVPELHQNIALDTDDKNIAIETDLKQTNEARPSSPTNDLKEIESTWPKDALTIPLGK